MRRCARSGVLGISVALVALVLVVAPTPDVRAAGPSKLDTTFPQGFTSLDVRRTNDSTKAVAVRPDGRVVIGGTALSGSFLVARFNGGGTLDTTFSGDGFDEVAIADGGAALALAVQPSDGRMVVAGEVQNVAGGLDVGIARFNP